jgi:hypothetical protein
MTVHAHPPLSKSVRPEDQSRARVLGLALVMIALQLCYRAWCIYPAGWIRDDFALIDRVLQPGGMSLSGLLRGYDSHLIPGVLLLTSMLTKAAPYNFHAAATLVLAMEALAALGMLRFLVVGFGARPGILAPMALYLVSPFAIQSAVWWTPGSHNLMIQVAMAWGLAFHITYLRTRRWGSALAAVICVVTGLLFLEKALLVIGAFAFVTVAYFTHGSALERLAQVWRNYRFSVLINLVLGLLYIAVYVHFALAFGAKGAAGAPVGPMVETMVLRSWVTGIFGGPIVWSDPGNPPVIAQPPPLLVVACLLGLVLFARELIRSRTCSLRSFWLPAYFLACNVLLVSAARGRYFGGIPGFELRYIGELSMASAMCLALATMPVRGAVEQVHVKRPSTFLDNRHRVVLACSAIALLSLISTTRYVHAWDVVVAPSSRWLNNLSSDLPRLPRGAAVIDESAPQSVVLPFEGDRISRLVRPLRTDLDFSQVATDRLYLSTATGHLRRVAVTPLRMQRPTKDAECGYAVRREQASIPLDAEVLFPGLWVRIGYLATGDSAVTVSAGGATYHTSVRSGFHDLYFQAGPDKFDAISIGGLIGRTRLCTDDVVVGQATPGEGS